MVLFYFPSAWESQQNFFVLYPSWFVLPQLPGWALLYQIRPSSISFLFSSDCCLPVCSTAEALNKDEPGWPQDKLQKGGEKLSEAGQSALRLLMQVSSKEGLHWSYCLCLKSDMLLVTRRKWSLFQVLFVLCCRVLGMRIVLSRCLFFSLAAKRVHSSPNT